MSKRNVDIRIMARDMASKKFKAVGLAAGGMTSMLKKAAAAALFYFGARAIKRQLQESTDAFMRQESAVMGLGDALTLLDKQAELKGMVKYAAQLQKITTIGDETTLELMKMGATMGKLSGDNLKDATKAAMGLAEAYDLELTAAMRLVARAAVGDTAQLKRYGIVLDQALTTQEKFNAVLKIGKDNFALVERQTRTVAGALQQAKNAIGDVREVIGEALAPVVKKAAIAIKSWAETHQDQIRTWAIKTVTWVETGMNIFKDFVKYLSHNFIDGMRWVAHSFVKILETMFKTAAVTAAVGAANVWKIIQAGITGKLTTITASAHAELRRRYEEAGGAWKIQHRGKGYFALDKDLWNQQKRDIQREATINEIERMGSLDLSAYIAKQWRATGQGIVKSLPGDLASKLADRIAEGQAKAAARLAANPAAQYGGMAGAPGAAVAQVMKQAAAKISQAFHPIVSRFLTFAPGTRFDAEKMTAKATQDTVTQIRGLRGDITKLFGQLLTVTRANSLTGISLEPARIGG